MSGHKQMILAYLQQGGTLTQRDAAEMFGCWRLGARIHELIKAGYPIDKVMCEGLNRQGVKTRWARYYLRK